MHHKIIVAIPTLNEERHIAGVIHDLLDDLPGKLEVIVVVADGGSRDKTREIVSTLARDLPNVHLIENKKRYQSAGVNAAVFQHGANTDFVVRCDAHSIYPKGFVARLVETATRTGADSVVVPMDSIGTQCFQRAVAYLSNARLGTGGAKHRAGRYSGWIEHGHHALMRTSRFLSIGGYNEKLTHVEDVEYDNRQLAAGARIYMDGEIRIKYFPRKSLQELARQYRNYGRGRAIVTLMTPESVQYRQILIALHFFMFPLSVIIGFFYLVAGIYAATYLGAVVAGALSITFRNRSLCGILAIIAAPTMHLAWGYGFAKGVAETLSGGNFRSDTVGNSAG